MGALDLFGGRVPRTEAELERMLASLPPEKLRELDQLLRGAPIPRSFRAFAERVNPRIRFYRHTRRLGRVIEDVVAGRRKRVICTMPPRRGKSEAVSRILPAYFLTKYPEQWVGLSSYAADLAHTMSRSARDYYTRWGGQLRADSAAVHHWQTWANGGMWSAGAGGPITGKGFHLGIIDDPLKDAAEALSERHREKLKDWYRAVWLTRAEPDAAIIVMATRWHVDDLIGWLLKLCEDTQAESGEPWHIVDFPEIYEGERPTPPGCTREPDWRQVGDVLCPERWSKKQALHTKANTSNFWWSALFQQSPTIREGSLFKWHWFTKVTARPTAAWRVRFWDTAGTEGGGDATAGGLMSRRFDGRYMIEDMVKGHWSPARRDAKILETAHKDAALFGPDGFEIGIEQETGIGGAERTQHLVRMLEGFRVFTVPATGSKVFRADGLASQAEVGNVDLLEGPWNNALLEELVAFGPGSDVDDQVDALSGAFNRLAALAQAEWKEEEFSLV